MRRALLLVMSAAVAATLLTPAAAIAQSQRRGDWYYDVRPYIGRSGGESVREARAWEEVISLRSAVRRLDRRGDITPRQADRFYDRIDRVARFLRDDRRLTSSEFDRRQDDLRDIARDLHRVARNRPVARYDDRYDRYDRRSDRRADICDVCDGVCRHR